MREGRFDQSDAFFVSYGRMEEGGWRFFEMMFVALCVGSTVLIFFVRTSWRHLAWKTSLYPSDAYGAFPHPVFSVRISKFEFDSFFVY